MTSNVFFDTDCLSAFLWVDNENILAKLFPGKIVIPMEVYNELSHPGLNHLKQLRNQVDVLINNGQASIERIMVGTDTYELYRKLTTNPDENEKIIGRGEAASIALAKEHCGIIASNNLKDISYYVEKFDLIHLTTGDILKMALEAEYINVEQGNIIWANMLSKRRKLGYQSFSEYLDAHK